MAKTRFGIMISGGGSTMKYLIEKTQDGGIPNATVAVVISSRETNPGVQKAQALGIPVFPLLKQRHFGGDERFFGKAICDRLAMFSVDYVLQCGWLPFTPDEVTEAYKGKIINQHPGFPEFGGKGMYGLAVHSATLHFSRKCLRPEGFIFTEASAHLVTPEIDGGQLVGRKPVRIIPDDTPESLHYRVLPFEHQLMAEVATDLAFGRLVTITRQLPLIRPEENTLLQQSIAHGIKSYPKG